MGWLVASVIRGILLLCLLLDEGTASLTQEDLDYIGTSLEINVKVVDNLEYNGGKHLFHVTLYNSGNTLIPESNWTIYFYSFFMIESDHLPKEGGIVLDSEKIRLNHIQGCLFSLSPVSGFGDLAHGQTKFIKFYGQNWAVSKSDIPPNWYITAENLQPRLIKSTSFGNPNFVSNFELPKQWKRYLNDVYNPYTPAQRYDRYKNPDVSKAKNAIIPTPKEIHMDDASHVTLDTATWRIKAETKFTKEAKILADKTMVPFEENSVPDMSTKTISIVSNNTLGAEEYYLNIDTTANNIVLKGSTFAGVFYGVQSLVSLLHGSPERNLPKTEIRDMPRFEFRGMYIDVSRNFHSKGDIKRLLDVMAMYKMNKFHIHLADDEGWRVEITGLPELIEIGSKRCHDLLEESCLISQLGSGPDTSTSGSGYYTQDDYIEIVRYANDRHIEVIPEIDTPGHARAAIKAMEARFKRLTSSGQPEADKYRLIDPADDSKYSSVQMFNDNAVNPCIESTYNFMSKVVDDLIAMHTSAGQQLKVFHFGGDEVASGAWENSTACRSLNINSTLTGREKYKEYFARRVANLTHLKGLNLGGWEDGLMDQDKNPYARHLLQNTDVIANAWDNVWEWGVAKRAYALANADYKVVLSHVTHLYFDHPYEPDPEERGLYWGPRFTDTLKTFSYNADDLYKNIDLRRSGAPINKTEVCHKDNSGCPPLTKRQNVIGLQGHLWSETVLTKTLFDYMIFPRILSIAERAWHEASWETTEDKDSRQNETLRDWNMFANAIGHKELMRLEELGVEYRVPPPGARLESNKLIVNTEFPSLTVELSHDYGDTWETVPENYEPKDNLLLRTKSKNGQRVSREVKFILPTDQLLLNYIANNMDIQFDVLDNLADGSATFVQKIRMKNLGSKDIRSGTWSIYMYHIRLVEPSKYPYPDGFLISGSGIRIFHVSGSLYKLQPDPETYQSLKPNAEIALQFHAKYWQSARTDTMPNWYVAADGLEPRTIKSTEGENLNFVGPFDTANKWKRYPGDQYDPYTLGARYEINKVAGDIGKPGKHLLPTPYMMTVDESSKVTITTGHWVIVQSSDFQNVVDFFTEKIPLSQVTTKPTAHYIEFIKDAVSAVQGAGPNSEAYKLVVDTANNIVTITANNDAGAFYGVQSLFRLSNKVPHGIEVPKAEITDQPRFGYRGMSLDVGRNFHSVDDVKMLLNIMAMYKMNKFHFHLADDEGWRLEIPGLEELTQVGSKRCHDLSEESCILPQLGSGPHSDSQGSGYFTMEQYKDILREAKKLHIKVIPEVDMPGHSHASIKSMERRYHYYKAMGNMTAAEEYLLSEIGDPSEYLTVQFFNDNAVNPCLNSTYKFIHVVMTTLKHLHEDIQPLSVYHFGGDEVAPGAWLNSTACKSLMNREPNINSVSDLKGYFARRVGDLAEAEMLDIGAWEDGVMKTLTEAFDKEMLIKSPRDIYGYSWNNVFEWGSGNHAYVLANAGYKVVLAHATHLYFDHPQEPDPHERGYYWATRFTDTHKTFGFVPDNIYANAHLKGSGVEYKPEEICKVECLKLQKPENILGIQGALWSETVRTADQLHYMIFPRFLALAERAWHKAEWENISNREERYKKINEDWNAFANTIGYKDLKLLDDMGVKYRVPLPGAKREDKRLLVNSAFPGLETEYSEDGGKTWKSAKGKPDIGYKSVLLRTRSAAKLRSSRVITLPESPFNVLSSATNMKFSVLLIIFTSVFLLTLVN